MRNLTLGPSLIRSSVIPQYHKVTQQEEIIKLAVESAHFQQNVPGFSRKIHLYGCKDHRALTVGKKISDWMDFLDANRLQVESG